MVNADDKIKTYINAQEVTMFIVPGIDEATEFETQTRHEIGVRSCHKPDCGYADKQFRRLSGSPFKTSLRGLEIREVPERQQKPKDFTM